MAGTMPNASMPTITATDTTAATVRAMHIHARMHAAHSPARHATGCSLSFTAALLNVVGVPGAVQQDVVTGLRRRCVVVR